MTLSSVIQKRTVFGKDGQFTGVVNAVGIASKSTIADSYVANSISSNDEVIFLLAASGSTNQCEVRAQTDHPISFLVNAQEKVRINRGFTNDIAAEVSIKGSSGTIDIYNALTNTSWNPIVSEGTKAVIFSDGFADTGTFAIAPHQSGSTATGIKIDGVTGNVGIATKVPARKLHVTGIVRLQGLSTYANNAAAIAGGLAAGDVYITNVAGDGQLRIVI
jgi:hypothetical protein